MHYLSLHKEDSNAPHRDQKNNTKIVKPMLHSMTGYGKASKIVAGKKITVEIKSLNSKQMDIASRVPSLLRQKDLEIRALVASRLVHGKVDVNINVENVVEDNAHRLNMKALRAYKNEIANVARELGVAEPTDWFSTLLRLPDAIESSEDDMSDEVGNAVMGAVNEALDALIAFRAQEGMSLRKVFLDNINAISNLIVEIEPFEKSRIEKIKGRMRERLEELGVEYDKNRFEQELIFYIEKLDVSEEKNRLRNHLKYFAEVMDNEDAPGKKLGFIAQEIGREVNTLGSKSNQSEMQIIVVKMKDHLEQIKEQVLNAL